MTPAERLSIEHACERVIRRAANLNDAGDWAGLAALFTEDGVYARPAEPEVLIRGREAILKGFTSRPPRLTRHVVSNSVVEVQGATAATATSLITLYIGDDSAPLPRITATVIGAFADRFEKHGDDWLLAERLGSLAMKT
jgi:hypothetical protein